ncbi:MAG: DUF2165 domain-containing protein [Candidatus Dadabacteria bacterium]|nr:DUF2165 domain-containing protein [Candidatus Dadabacteria bacterium]
MLIRKCKTSLVGAMALIMAIVTLNNIIDPGANFPFVQHVMSMDSIFPHSTLKWRAITSPALHQAAWWIIILWQAVVAVLLALGTLKLRRATKSGKDFQQSKETAVTGLTLGALLFLVVFLTIGGEWFVMWQSGWNAQNASFRFFALFAFVLLILLNRDDTESGT